MAYDVFISYSRRDIQIADRIEKELEKYDISCFIDRSGIDLGDDFAGIIAKAIHESEIMLFVWSENSNQSENTANEIALAIDFQKTIISFKIGEFKAHYNLAYRLVRYNRIDAVTFNEPQVIELGEKIAKRLGKTIIKEKAKEENPAFQNDDTTVKQPVTKPTAECLLKIRPNITCEVWIDGEKNTLANADQITKIPLNRGTFWLEFKSVANEQDIYACEYTITNSEHLLTVDLERIVKERIEKVELRWFKENDKYGFKVSGTGEVVIQAKYDDAWDFSEGLARVELNGKWGYIDKTDKVIIPFKYDFASHFSDGLASVGLNGKWGFIDKTDKVIIPFKYEFAMDFSEGLASVELNGKYGYIDKTDKVIIPFKYKSARGFSKGLARVRLGDTYGYIDKKENFTF